MSTFTEIESAVDSLPRAQQEALLQKLAQRLTLPTSNSPATDVDAIRRRRWIEELRQLRLANITGRTGAPLQKVMDELREDRN